MIAVVTGIDIRGTRKSADVQGVSTSLKAGVIVLLSALLMAALTWSTRKCLVAGALLDGHAERRSDEHDRRALGV